MSVTLRDFQPLNRWTPDFKGPTWYSYYSSMKEAQFLIDETTQRRYLNEDKATVGIKCVLLSLGTPLVHSVAAIINIAYRIAKLVTLSHFVVTLSDFGGNKSYSVKTRAAEAGKDLLRLVATPLALLGLELAAIYGFFRPYDGRKLYASIERATYGNFILAPCFQPNPTHHALGGDIHKKNAF